MRVDFWEGQIRIHRNRLELIENRFGRFKEPASLADNTGRKNARSSTVFTLFQESGFLCPGTPRLASIQVTFPLFFSLSLSPLFGSSTRGTSSRAPPSSGARNDVSVNRSETEHGKSRSRAASAKGRTRTRRGAGGRGRGRGRGRGTETRTLSPSASPCRSAWFYRGQASSEIDQISCRDRTAKHSHG